MLTGKKLLVTGPSSQVGFAVVRALAPHNEIHGLARFGKPADRERVEALGVRCVATDLASGPLDALSDDYDAVLHFAVARSGDFVADLDMNAGGTGRLMRRCRRAKAFLHCSSAAVYEYADGKPLAEDAPLGDNHRVLMPTYSLAKIAAEAMARFGSREYGIPTTIARLSVPYGEEGGWPFYHLLMMEAGAPIPIHPQRPNLYNPIHEDDIVAHLPKLLGCAASPPTVVNWGGSEPVSIEAWCEWMGELTGLRAKLLETRQALGPLPVDVTRMHALLGPTRVAWRDGIRRMLGSRRPDLLRAGGR